MKIHGYELIANVSLLFTEVELADRFAAARAAGFNAVECWWPFASAAPDAGEVDALLSAIDRAGVRLAGMNFFGGDLSTGDRGVLCQPDRVDEFQHSLAVVSTVADRTGCRVFNALYGQRRPEFTAETQDATAVANLTHALAVLAPHDATILLEALSVGENGDYPLSTCGQVADVIRAVAATTSTEHLRLLFDTYHLTNNGEDLLESIERYGPLIGHVQFADAPGRGQPGTGKIDFRAVLGGLRRAGYPGIVAAEYRPSGHTSDSLAWIADLDNR